MPSDKSSYLWASVSPTVTVDKDVGLLDAMGQVGLDNLGL